MADSTSWGSDWEDAPEDVSDQKAWADKQKILQDKQYALNDKTLDYKNKALQYEMDSVGKKSGPSFTDLLPGITTNALPTVNNAAGVTQGQEYSEKNLPADLLKKNKDAIKTLDTDKTDAADALDDSADKLKTLYGTTGAKLTESGQSLLDQGLDRKTIDNMDYDIAHERTRESMDTAQDILKDEHTAATIDPDDFVKNLPWPQKILTALGMLISGAGSGLTGGPNLAIEQFNKAVQRNIDAKQATFNNLAKAEAAARGQVLSGQQQQQISLLANQIATIDVTNGMSGVVQGLGMQNLSLTAQAAAKQARFSLDQQNQKALLDLGSQIGTASNTRSAQHMGGIALVVDALMNHKSGKGTILDRYSLNPDKAKPTVPDIPGTISQSSSQDVKNQEGEKNLESSQGFARKVLDNIGEGWSKW